MSRASLADPGISRINSSSQGVALSASRLRMVVPSPSTARFSSIRLQVLLHRGLSRSGPQKIEQHPEAHNQKQNE